MQDTALPWLILGLTHSPVYVGMLVFARYAPFMLFGLHSGRARRPVRQPADGDRHPDGLAAGCGRPCGARILGRRRGLALFRPRLPRRLGAGLRRAEPPCAHLPARRARGAAERRRAQLVSVQRRPDRRARDRWRADRRRRRRLVLRDQRRDLPGGADRPAADAALRALPARRAERGQGRAPRSARASATHGGRPRSGSSSRSRPSSATTGFNFRVLLPVLASKTLHSSAPVFGVLFASLRRRRAARRARCGRDVARPRWRAVVARRRRFQHARCSCLLPCATRRSRPGSCSSSGFCFSTWTANSQSILQLTAPDRLRGRVLCLYLFVFAGFSPIGGLLAGWLADVGGTELAFAVAGLSGLVATGVAAARLRDADVRRAGAGPVVALAEEEPSV